MADKTKTKEGEFNQFKVGSFTRDTGLASGNQAVAGVGFKPTSVVFLACQNNAVGEMSTGMDDRASPKDVWDRFNTGADIWGVSSNSIKDDEGGGKLYEGIISALDVDGFTITWTKTGLPTGTLTVIYLAMR